MSRRDPAITGEGLQNLAVLVFLALHIPLAISMRYFSEVATLHAFATVAIGLYWLTLPNSLERAAYVAAYITGAEVLWRMTSAHVFWEFGKYATAAIFLLAMLRTGRLKGPILPILYFAFLLPSVLFTFQQFDLDQARQQVSFNMSGPFALMVSVLFFSHMKLSLRQIRQLLIMIIGPIVGQFTHSWKQ